jgi:hypothetical protein
VVLSVAPSEIHHVPAVQLANCNSRVRADYDAELLLSTMPESVADALDSRSRRSTASVDQPAFANAIGCRNVRQSGARAQP